MDKDDAKNQANRAADKVDDAWQQTKQTAKDWKDSAKETVQDAGQKIKDMAQ